MLRAGVLIVAVALLRFGLGDVSEIDELRENVPKKRERLKMGTDVKMCEDFEHFAPPVVHPTSQF